MDRINCCRVGFVLHHMVRHATWHDGALAQVTHVFSGDPETSNFAEYHLIFYEQRVLPCINHLYLAGASLEVILSK